MTLRSVLLVGRLVYIGREWEKLKNVAGVADIKEYSSGSRDDFIQRCDEGEFDDVVALYRNNVPLESVVGLFDRQLIEHLPKSLKYICHNGAGYDNIDVPACTNRGIRVSHTPQVVNNATADTGMFLMLGALRQASMGLSILRQGQWGSVPPPTAHDPYGKTLGILGFGGIGRAIASRARAFGMRIQYHDLSRLPPTLEGDAKYVDFKTLLSSSDVLSLNLNLTPETIHIISKKELAMVKRGITIINTARGKLIDEAALVEALDDGDRIWSVGLDVFEDEPKVHPGLVANPRVFLLPHIGTLTFETRKAMEMLALENIKSVIENGKLLTGVSEQHCKI